MLSSLDKLYYSVEYIPKLSNRLSDKLYYDADVSILDLSVEGTIVDLTGTSFTMKETTKEYGYGLLKGSVFEKTEETKYNVKVNLKYNNKIIQSIKTTDGDFIFENVNPALQYDIDFIDETGKYLSKSVSITPELDLEQNPKIFMFDELKLLSDNINLYFGIYALGDPQVSLSRAPSTLTVSKINETTYLISGPISNKNLDFDILLDDYRESGLKSTTYNVKQDKSKLVKFDFKNTLSDTSGRITSEKVGNPVLSSNNISIDTRANSIKINSDPIFIVEPPNFFSIYIDMDIKAFKNPTVVGNKYFISTSGDINSNTRPFQLLVEDNKYLKINIKNRSGAWINVVNKVPIGEIKMGQRNKIFIEYKYSILNTYLNGVLISSWWGQEAVIGMTDSGPLIFGGYGIDTNNDRDTIFDLYEFRFTNGYYT